MTKISIHAAREGGDGRRFPVAALHLDISIHAAREGGDPAALNQTALSPAISIHAAREGGDPQRRVRHPCCAISIHAAREGGDVAVVAVAGTFLHFNPRRP